MDVRIGLELRGKKKSEITELDLSNCKTGGEIDGLNEDFSSLETLDLQNASLTNIKLFPKLATLKKLDLSGNRLSKGLEVLKDCPNLESLSLTNNKFKEFESLQPLADLKLTHLDLDGNEFPESKEEFRKKVFQLLPNLAILDGADKDGVEANSDDDDDDDDDDVEDDEDIEEEEDDDEESEEEEDGPGLSALYDKSANLDDDDEDDYDGEGAEGEDSADEDVEDEEETPQKGVKRKHEDEEKVE